MSTAAEQPTGKHRKKYRPPKPPKPVMDRPVWFDAHLERYKSHVTGAATPIDQSITWVAARTIIHETDFSGMYLNLMSFRDSELVGCDFTRAILVACDFSGAYLRDCIFDRAILFQSMWVDTVFVNCSFSGACPEPPKRLTSQQIDKMWSLTKKEDIE